MASRKNGRRVTVREREKLAEGGTKTGKDERKGWKKEGRNEGKAGG